MTLNQSSSCTLQSMRESPFSTPHALNQPIATLVVGMKSMADLEQNVGIARNFSPMSQAEQQELLAEVKDAAGDGRYERFKTSKQFDAPHHRKQHGFPLEGT